MFCSTTVSLVLLLLLVVRVTNVLANEDSLFRMSATSLRNGQGPITSLYDVVIGDIGAFMEVEVFKKKASVMYLDAPWSFDSSRGWGNNVFQEIYGNITNSGIPMYVYNYHGWSPAHPYFLEWWQKHVETVSDFPEFEFTKYRALFLVLKGNAIVKGMINVVSGEGGGFCIHKIVMEALGEPISREDMAEKEVRYYDRACVEQARHPERSKSVFMHGSPCGWRNSELPPLSACDAHYSLDDEL